MASRTKFKWIRADRVRSWQDFENEVNSFLEGKEVVHVTSLHRGIGIGIFYRESDKKGK